MNSRLMCSLLLLIFLVTIATVASSADPVLVEKINVDPSTICIFVGKTTRIKTNIEPRNATSKKLEWSSSDDSIATVNNGTIRGISCGSALITVASSDASTIHTTIEVTVIQPVLKINIPEKNLVLAPGTHHQIKWVVDPANASIPEVTWSSSNEKVVVVDNNGMLSGIRKGSARITATATDGSGVKTHFTVKVDEFDLVFTSKKPQKLRYRYSSGTGNVKRRGTVKNGNVSIDNIDADMWLSTSGGSDTIKVTPLKPGTDIVTLTFNGKKINYSIFIADYFQNYETQYFELTDTSPNIANGSFRDIVYGTPYSEIKDQLVKQYGNNYKIEDLCYGFVIRFNNPKIEVAGHEIVSISFGFCYALDKNGYITKDESSTSFYKAKYLFDLGPNESVAENLHAKMNELYGKSYEESHLSEHIRKLKGSDKYSWSNNEIDITLDNRYDLSLSYSWDKGVSRQLQLYEAYEYEKELEKKRMEETVQSQYSNSTDGL